MELMIVRKKEGQLKDFDIVVDCPLEEKIEILLSSENF